MQENNLIHQAFPGSDGDDSIRQDVFNQAATLRSRYQHSKRIRRTVFGAIATIAIVSGMAVVGPSAYALYQIQRLAGSVDDCDSAIMEDFELGKDGKFHSNRMTMYFKGNWRFESHGTTQIYTKHTYWNYDPGLNRVTKQFKPDGPFAYNNSGFSVRAMMADQTRWNWRGTTAKLGSGMLDGRPSEILTIEQSTWPTRSVIYADPTTHMPAKLTFESKSGNGWEMKGYATFKINTIVDPKLFEPTFPASAKVIDKDHVTSDWAKKLETEIATMASAHRKMVIRDYYVNERGHIFVIYTDGETAQDREQYAKSMRDSRPASSVHWPTKWSVIDSSGMTYFASGNFQPYMNTINGQRNPCIVLKDGEILQGAWLVPSKTAQWQPKTLIFSGAVRVDAYTDEPSSTWTIKVQKPNQPLVPDWSEACHIAPRSEQDILKEEDEVHMVPDMIKLDPKTGRAIPDKNGMVIQKYHRGR